MVNNNIKKDNSKKKHALTKRQKEILNYIKKYIANNGYAPSFREIGNANNLTSTASVHAHLQSLINNGQIKKIDHKFRTIEIVGENEFLNKKVNYFNIILINDTDNFYYSLENSNNYITISKKIKNIDGNCFALKVFQQEKFYDNDLLIIKRNAELKFNDYVIILNNNKPIVTRYNENIKNVIGKVIALIREF